jgi:hypothetical protein
MKKKLLNSICKIIGLMLLSTVICQLSTDVNAAKKSVTDVAGVIVQTKGNVEILPNGEKKNKRVRSGMFVYEGDELKTGAAAFVKIVFVSGAQVNVNEQTDFIVDLTPASSKGQGNHVKLNKGEAHVNAYRKGVKFNMNTPTAVVAVRGTQYVASVGKGYLMKGPLMTAVLCLEGTLEVSNENGTVKVKENEMTEVAPGNAPNAPVPVTEDMKDKLVKWKDETKVQVVGKIKIKADKGTVPVDSPVRIEVEIINDKGETITDYNKDVDVSGASPSAQYSTNDGANWNAKSIKLENGKGTILAKDTVPGYLLTSFLKDELEGITLTTEIKQSITKKTLKLKLKTDTGAERNLKIRFSK